MATISITISMYDRSRRAAVTLPDSTSVETLMEQCSQRWALPLASFIFRNVGSNQLLLEEDSLRQAGVASGSELQIFPLVEGGRSSFTSGGRAETAPAAGVPSAEVPARNGRT